MITRPSSRNPTASSIRACVPTTMCIEPPDSSAWSSRRRLAGVAPVIMRQPEARPLEQPADVDEVLLRQDFGRRHERHLEAVLHRHERRHQRHDGLARTDVPLQQPVHRLRPLHVADDFAERLLLIAGQLERQDPPRRLADLFGDHHRPRLALRIGSAFPQDDPQLEQEELLEDQPAVRVGSKRVERVEVRALRRKVHVRERPATVDQLLALSHVFGQRIRKRLRQLRQRLVDEHALHLRGQRAGLLVDRHDAAGVQRVDVALRRLPRLHRVLTTSYCGFCICRPCEVSSSLP